MASVGLLDSAGRRRFPATLSGFHQGRVPRNKGLRYPPDPPTVEEIIAVMRPAGDGPEATRLRGVIIVLWRASLRISEALALAETDLDRQRGAVLVRAGKDGRRREDGIDRWAWEQLDPWLELRRTLPVGALFCVVHGPTRGRPCAPAAIRGPAASHRGGRRSSPPVRTTPTAARPRCRDVTRGHPAPGHSAPARATCRSRDQLRVPARDRQHRDHPRGPRATGRDDARRPNAPRLSPGRLSASRRRCLGPSARVSGTAARGPQHPAHRHDRPRPVGRCPDREDPCVAVGMVRPAPPREQEQSCGLRRGSPPAPHGRQLGMNHGDLTIERQSVTPATLTIDSSTAVVRMDRLAPRDRRQTLVGHAGGRAKRRARAAQTRPRHAAQQTEGVYRGSTPETIAQHEAAGADQAGKTGVMRLRPYG